MVLFLFPKIFQTFNNIYGFGPVPQKKKKKKKKFIDLPNNTLSLPVAELEIFLGVKLNNNL